MCGDDGYRNYRDCPAYPVDFLLPTVVPRAPSWPNLWNDEFAHRDTLNVGVRSQ